MAGFFCLRGLPLPRRAVAAVKLSVYAVAAFIPHVPVVSFFLYFLHGPLVSKLQKFRKPLLKQFKRNNSSVGYIRLHRFTSSKHHQPSERSRTPGVNFPSLSFTQTLTCFTGCRSITGSPALM